MKPQRTHEDGNAVVGFVATVDLLLLVVLTVMGIGFTWFAREVMNDSVALGARIAGLDGSNEEIAHARTAELITATLPASYANNIVVTYGSDWVDVSATARAPVFGLILPITIEVSARAPIE